MRNCFQVVASLCVTWSVFAANAATSGADESLQNFFKRYLDERFTLHPTEATALGDHRFDDKLDDLSPEALERSLNHLKQTRARLRKEIDHKKVSRDSQVDFEIFDHELGASIWLRENTKR